MTDTSTPAARPEAKPYLPPTLTTYGDVRQLTAGPESGNLDQLVGASGGFLPDDPGSIDIAEPDR